MSTWAFMVLSFPFLCKCEHFQNEKLEGEKSKVLVLLSCTLTVSEGGNHHEWNLLRCRVFIINLLFPSSTLFLPSFKATSRIFTYTMCKIIFSQKTKKIQLPGWLNFFGLLGKRCMQCYCPPGDASNCKVFFLGEKAAGCVRGRTCAVVSSLSCKGFPTHTPQENTTKDSPMGPQTSLGCVAEFSVETQLNILIFSWQMQGPLF